MIQALEDMLRDCIIDFKGSSDEKLYLVEFVYNNNFQKSTGMAEEVSAKPKSHT